MVLLSLACAFAPQLIEVEAPSEVPDFVATTLDGEPVDGATFLEQRQVVVFVDGVDDGAIGRLREGLRKAAPVLEYEGYRWLTLVVADDPDEVRRWADGADWPGRVAVVPPGLFGYRRYHARTWGRCWWQIPGDGTLQVHSMKMASPDHRAGHFHRFAPRDRDRFLPSRQDEWSEYTLRGLDGGRLIVRRGRGHWEAKLAQLPEGVSLPEQAFVLGPEGEPLGEPFQLTDRSLAPIPIPSGFPTGIAWRDGEGGRAAWVDFVEWTDDPITLAHERLERDGLGFEIWAQQMGAATRFLVRITNQTEEPIWGRNGTLASESSWFRSPGNDPDALLRTYGSWYGISKDPPALDDACRDRLRDDPGGARFLVGSAAPVSSWEEAPDPHERYVGFGMSVALAGFLRSAPETWEAFVSGRRIELAWTREDGITLEVSEFEVDSPWFGSGLNGDLDSLHWKE